MTLKSERPSDSTTATTLTRRGFVKTGGALFVSLGIPAGLSAQAAESQDSLHTNQLDPTLLASWLEIRNDDTILARTGRGEIGTGMSAFYPVE
jgi:nicotinate dehydrogenase subunit B